MVLMIASSAVPALIVLSLLSLLLRERSWVTPFTYAACLGLTMTTLLAAVLHLLSRADPQNLALPLGLPWLGARLRIDALSAVFFVIINLGAAAASDKRCLIPGAWLPAHSFAGPRWVGLAG